MILQQIAGIYSLPVTRSIVSLDESVAILLGEQIYVPVSEISNGPTIYNTAGGMLTFRVGAAVPLDKSHLVPVIIIPLTSIH